MLLLLRKSNATAKELSTGTTRSFWGAWTHPMKIHVDLFLFLSMLLCVNILIELHKTRSTFCLVVLEGSTCKV
jgi:hypothetical protein